MADDPTPEELAERRELLEIATQSADWSAKLKEHRAARSRNLVKARKQAQELRAQGIKVGGRKPAKCPQENCPCRAAPRFHYCPYKLNVKQDDTRCRCCADCEGMCQTDAETS